MATRQSSKLMQEALTQAIQQRSYEPGQLIHQSDRGSQYTSNRFQTTCELNGIQCSMGGVGDCYDNAMAESFFSSLETELLDQERFRNRAEAKSKIINYMDGFYNTTRLHSSLGYVSPIDFEARTEGEESSMRLKLNPYTQKTRSVGETIASPTIRQRSDRMCSITSKVRALQRK